MNKYWYVGGVAILVIAGFAIIMIRWGSADEAVNVLKNLAQGGSSAEIDAEQSAITPDDDAITLDDSDGDHYNDAQAPASSSISSSVATKSESNAPQSTAAKQNTIVQDDSVTDAQPDRSSSAENSPSVTKSAPSCSFPAAAPSSTHEIIFNEIAWMGSPSSSGAEWIELKNISAGDIDLSGWSVLDASQRLKITLSQSDVIPAGGLFMLSRGNGNGEIYAGDLVNGGDVIAIIDPQCETSDYLDASHGWPGGDNSTKQTLERDADGDGWHTSALPGGTPDENNSAGPPPVNYTLTIAFEGAGGDVITSDPPDLVCGTSCSGSYASGTTVMLTPTPNANAIFSGWSGMCYGQTACFLIMNGNISLSASFTAVTDVPSSTVLTDVGQTTSTPATSTSDASSSDQVPPPNAPQHVLIQEVQIAGDASTNDVVRIYNPTAAAVDMSGWKLHKKSQTGTDYSLKTFPTGSVIASGGVFIWANSAGGYSETVNANVSSTETLSADNSVALMHADGTIVDAVAWGTGTDQYVEGSAYPTDPAAGQVLGRRSTTGVMTDTDNNANDFILE